MLHPVYAKAGQRLEAEKAEKPTQDKTREAVLIESARKIVEQGGDCCGQVWIECDDCPFQYVECGNSQKTLSLAQDYLDELNSSPLTPAQEIALLAQPYMPHDKWVELYEAIEKALGEK